MPQKCSHSPEPAGNMKRIKPGSEPLASKRKFIIADLHWTSFYGKEQKRKGRFLTDSGCDIPILNQDYVWKHRIPTIAWADPKRITDAAGRQIEGAGKRYS